MMTENDWIPKISDFFWNKMKKYDYKWMNLTENDWQRKKKWYNKDIRR